MADPTAASLVSVALIAGSPSAAPESTIDIGVRFDVAPGWHIYWENPGESGMATSAELQAPGATFGPLRFPAPHRYEMAGGIQTYGHGGDPVFLRTMRIAPDATGPLEITGSARYLVCQADRCLYGEQPLSLTLPLDGTGEGTGEGTGPGVDRLADARAALPVLPATVVGRAPTDDGVQLRLWGLSGADAFPERALDDALAGLTVESRPDETVVTLTRSGDAPLPDDSALVLTGTHDGRPVAWRLPLGPAAAPPSSPPESP